MFDEGSQRTVLLIAKQYNPDYLLNQSLVQSAGSLSNAYFLDCHYFAVANEAIEKFMQLAQEHGVLVYCKLFAVCFVRENP